MEVLSKRISIKNLQTMADHLFGNLVKTVLDKRISGA